MDCKDNPAIKLENEETTHVYLPVTVAANIKTEPEFLPTCKAEPLDPIDPSYYIKAELENFHSCPFCAYTTSNVRYLNRHLKRHPPKFHKDKIVCNICGYTTIERKNLDRHILVHTDEKPFSCSLCPFKCRQKGYLKDHMKTHTRRVSTDIPRLTCNECNFSTIWRSSLKTHILMHQTDKPFRCAECDMAFSVRGYLKKHMFIHTKERPFHCTFCNYKAYRRYHLKVHLRKHENMN